VRNGSVKTGIDVLEAHGFDALKVGEGKRKIGLVTNQTGVDAEGRRTIDVLASAPGVSLEAIFSPEHGVTGAVDTTDIGNSKDAATGTPVYSVYGASDAARRPSIDVLKGLDAVVFDIQDAGVRFYTYETTLGYFLEAAAKAGILGLTYSCANSLAKYGITCNAIMPGAATRMTDTIPANFAQQMGLSTSSEAAQTSPMDPNNVAPIVAYLASDNAAHVNGQVFGASGYRIALYTHIVPEKVIYSQGPWDLGK